MGHKEKWQCEQRPCAVKPTVRGPTLGSSDLGWRGQSSGIDMTITSPRVGTVPGQLDLCIPRAATALASRMWGWM